MARDPFGGQSSKNLQDVLEYVAAVTAGRKVVGKEILQACLRFNRDLKNPAFDFRTKDAEFVVWIIEHTMVHQQGEQLDGSSLKGKPLLLEPWEKFIIFNLLGFYLAGTNERRFKEAFIFIPRKNGKTTFVGALAFALAILQRRSGSHILIVGAALKQARMSFDFILDNIGNQGERDEYRILDNNAAHSIERRFYDDAGAETGYIKIEALAANPDAHDSFNCNIAIADEIHAYKSPKQYNIIKEAMKAYTNKLMIGITTAGDNFNSFCYRHLELCLKIVSGQLTNEQMFVFISRADQSTAGDVDYTNPLQHEKANPNYGVTIRPSDIEADAWAASNDPQNRKDFLAKSLNIYTSSLRAYFDIDKIRASDAAYSWTLEDLRRMRLKWYGGSDLAKLHDLTAAALVAMAGDVLVIIPHCWFPVVAAREKADKDNIPLFGWQDDGWLNMSNSPTTNHAEIVNWYKEKRQEGFSIKQVGHDKKFCREYYIGMKRAGFKVIDQPQLYIKKSEGFRYIEEKANNGKLYFLHADPFLYCIANVHAIEKTDDMIQYEKIETEYRIDVFDAAVFATIRMLEDMEKRQAAAQWFEEDDE